MLTMFVFYVNDLTILTPHYKIIGLNHTPSVLLFNCYGMTTKKVNSGELRVMQKVGFKNLSESLLVGEI